jgi:hypothetical protein
MRGLSRWIEPRDLEILRSLVRLRYVPTRLLNKAFFSHERVGRRRLQKLAERGYIKLHMKGVPPRDPTGAWRITRDGLGAVIDAFPDERIPTNLIERVTEGSLRSLYEREPASQLYLDVVVPAPDPLVEGPRIMRCRQWALEVRRRASAITWRPRNDIVLRYDFVGTQEQVVPDVTVTSPARQLRLFLHYDRFGTRRKWAAHLFEHHNRYLGFHAPMDRGFSDGHEPIFVFVTANQARARGIETLLRQVAFQRMRWFVIDHWDAARWLRESLIDTHEAERAA